MRILVASAIYPTPSVPRVLGGAEVFARDLAETLAADGHQVAALRAVVAGTPELEPAGGVAVHATVARNLGPPFAARRNTAGRLAWHILDDRVANVGALQRVIADSRPDIVHTNGLFGITHALWRVAREAGIPIVHTLHDYYLTCPRCSRFSRGHRCETTCFICRLTTRKRRAAAGAVDAVVGVSARILAIHQEEDLFCDSPIRTVVRNAATVTGLVPGPHYRDGPITVGFIGRLSYEKGIEQLIRSVSLLPGSSIRLKIAGRISDDDRRRMIDLAAGADLTFLGFVKPQDFYPQVDLIAVPSIWEEPAPLVVAEAHAAGRPVLVTPFGGLPEMVVAGETGWISQPTVEGLRDTLAGIIESRAALPKYQDHSAAAGRSWTFQDVVKCYKTIYEDLIARKTV